MSKRTAFLAGERPEDVALYLADSFVDDLGKLEKYGEETDDGIVIVVNGEDGRNAFHAATGNDAMAFAKRAMDTEGTVHADLAGADCPAAGEDAADDAEDEDHHIAFVFAFSEEQNEEVGGLYAEGAVVHAYAQCDCGTAFSDKWVAGERD